MFRSRPGDEDLCGRQQHRHTQRAQQWWLNLAGLSHGAPAGPAARRPCPPAINRPTAALVPRQDEANAYPAMAA